MSSMLLSDSSTVSLVSIGRIGLTGLWSLGEVSGDITRFNNACSAHFGGKIKEFDSFLMHFILFHVDVEICFITESQVS